MTTRMSIVRNVLSSTVAFLGLIESAGATIVFEETFDGLPTVACIGAIPPTNEFATGWLRRDVDQGTPDGQVYYVLNAWRALGDVSGPSPDCKAFSTSFYTPTIANADDWMWTPAITLPTGVSSDLTWNARAYDSNFRDGYEVRIMTASAGPPSGGAGMLGNQVSNSSVLFSVAQEATVETTHRVSLAAFAGTSVYIGFRNNSSDKFILVVDDVRVSTNISDLDLAEVPLISEYVFVPADFRIAPPIAATARNIGTGALSNVFATATLLIDGQAFGSPVSSNVLSTLSQDASSALSFPPLPARTVSGFMQVRYAVSASPADQDASNNQVLTDQVFGTTDELSRADTTVTGQLGIGTGEGGELGYQFTLQEPMSIRAIKLTFAEKSAASAPGWAGLPIRARLRAITTDAPDALTSPGLATTLSAPAVNEQASYTLPFASPVSLAPGTYVVTAIEPAGADGTLPLFTSPRRFVRRHTWINWPSRANWGHFEDFGSSFARMPLISLLTTSALFADSFENGPTVTVVTSSKTYALEQATFAGSPSQDQATELGVANSTRR